MITFVRPSVQLLPKKRTPSEKLEYCARVCYNSFNRITDGSAHPFLASLLDSGHSSMMEHVAVYIDHKMDDQINKAMPQLPTPVVRMIQARSAATDMTWNVADLWTVLKQAGVSSLEFLDYIDSVFTNEDQSQSLYFVLTRGVATEFTRHRTLRPTQSSTRFCDGEKQGLEFCLPEPYWWADQDDSTECIAWKQSCLVGYNAYTTLRRLGTEPGVARDALPQSQAAHLILTGSTFWWQRFMCLRYHPAAHPMAILLCRQAEELDNINRKLFAELDPDLQRRALIKIENLASKKGAHKGE